MEYIKHLPSRLVRHWLSAPIIYAVIVPVIFLDLVTEIYHRVCFPLYGLAYVERSRYISFDRNRLPYLNAFEKFNCMYCGYVNGALRYIGEIAARSEWYWCGIMHERTKGFIAAPHHKDFLPFGDEAAFRAYVGKPFPKKRKKKKTA